MARKRGEDWVLMESPDEARRGLLVRLATGNCGKVTLLLGDAAGRQRHLHSTREGLRVCNGESWKFQALAFCCSEHAKEADEISGGTCCFDVVVPAKGAWRLADPDVGDEETTKVERVRLREKVRAR